MKSNIHNAVAKASAPPLDSQTRTSAAGIHLPAGAAKADDGTLPAPIPNLPIIMQSTSSTSCCTASPLRVPCHCPCAGALHIFTAVERAPAQCSKQL